MNAVHAEGLVGAPELVNNRIIGETAPSMREQSGAKPLDTELGGASASMPIKDTEHCRSILLHDARNVFVLVRRVLRGSIIQRLHGTKTVDDNVALSAVAGG